MSVRSGIIATAGAAAAVLVIGSAAPLAGAATAVSAAPSAVTPTISVLAGGVGGPGPARQVPLTVCGTISPCPLKFAGGRIYFGEGRGLIRSIGIKGGQLSTPAGNGTGRVSANGVPATATGLNSAGGATLDGSGNLLYTGIFDSIVRVVAARAGMFYGQ